MAELLGLFVLLAVATVVGRALARRGGDAATLANLGERITSWWAMVAILGLAFALGPLATTLL
ncbi:MAG TPA: phosphatidate cytidylyltransferase, partial [Amaricoccus sp.]|nr:phosphatidate cytidylyltransferase [Amaricoccus sp.]